MINLQGAEKGACWIGYAAYASQINGTYLVSYERLIDYEITKILGPKGTWGRSSLENQARTRNKEGNRSGSKGSNRIRKQSEQSGARVTGQRGAVIGVGGHEARVTRLYLRRARNSGIEINRERHAISDIILSELVTTLSNCHNISHLTQSRQRAPKHSSIYSLFLIPHSSIYTRLFILNINLQSIPNPPHLFRASNYELVPELGFR